MSNTRQHSSELFKEAKQYIPGGVNSPVRAFNGVGGDPVFFNKAKGAYLFDADDKQYIDYVGSWGPMITGHADQDIIAAITNTAQNGLSFGAPTAIEIELAKKICSIMPSIEKVRMVNSGTEATMSAIRLARGFTQRDKIIKFEGCYHGHGDSLLVKAGSGALTLGVPNSPGIPADLAQHTITLSFNDHEQLREVMAKQGDEIACIIIEPIAGNMNMIAPKDGFLNLARELCDKSGSLLIIDEVMTGFRVALGGAQSIYAVKPDITTLGKVIGAGMPVGAFGGRKEVMDTLAPDGPVYQAGTLSGNPLAMAAGLCMLNKLSADGFYQALGAKTEALRSGIQQAADDAGVAFTSLAIGGMFGLFFTEQNEVSSFAQSCACDQEQFKRFFHGMLDRGVYMAPSAFEAGFVSSAHSDDDIAKTIACASEVFKSLK